MESTLVTKPWESAIYKHRHKIVVSTGAVLSMLQDDGKWHPCAYLLKGFNDMECNYDVHNKEMMGIMHALEAW